MPEMTDYNPYFQFSLLTENDSVPFASAIGFSTNAITGVASYPFSLEILRLNPDENGVEIYDAREIELTASGFFRQRNLDIPTTGTFCGAKRYRTKRYELTSAHAHSVFDWDDIYLPAEEVDTTEDKAFDVVGNNITVATTTTGDGVASEALVSDGGFQNSHTITTDTELAFDHQKQWTHSEIGYSPHVYSKRTAVTLSNEVTAATLTGALTTWLTTATLPGSLTESARSSLSESTGSGTVRASAAIARTSAPKYSTTPDGFNGDWPTFYNGISTANIRLVTRRNLPAAVWDGSFAESSQLGISMGSRVQTLSIEVTENRADEYGVFAWPEETTRGENTFDATDAAAAVEDASFTTGSAEVYWFYAWQPAETAFVSRDGQLYRITLEVFTVASVYNEETEEFEDVETVHASAVLETSPSTLIARRLATAPPEDLEYLVRVTEIRRYVEDAWVLMASLDPAESLPLPEAHIGHEVTDPAAWVLRINRARTPNRYGIYSYDLESVRRFTRESFSLDQATPIYPSPAGGCPVRPSGSFTMEGYRDVSGFGQYERQTHVLSEYTKELGGIDAKEWVMVPVWELPATSLRYLSYWEEFLSEGLDESSVTTSETTFTVEGNEGIIYPASSYLVARDRPNPRGEILAETWVSAPANVDAGTYFATAVQAIALPAAGATVFLEAGYLALPSPPTTLALRVGEQDISDGWLLGAGVSDGDPVALSFEIENTGENPLVITGASSSNAMFSLGSLPGAIAPGDTAEIEVTFAPGSTQGIFEATITLTANVDGGMVSFPVTAATTDDAAGCNVMDHFQQLEYRTVVDSTGRWFEVGFRLDLVLDGNAADGWVDPYGVLEFRLERGVDLETWDHQILDLGAPVETIPGFWDYWARLAIPAVWYDVMSDLRITSNRYGKAITELTVAGSAISLPGYPYAMPADAADLQADLRAAGFADAVVSSTSATISLNILHHVYEDAYYKRIPLTAAMTGANVTSVARAGSAISLPGYPYAMPADAADLQADLRTAGYTGAVVKLLGDPWEIFLPNRSTDRTAAVSFTPDDPHKGWNFFGTYIGEVPDNSEKSQETNLRNPLGDPLTENGVQFARMGIRRLR